MNKRALMLTAATAALMSGPAFASCPSPAPSWTTINSQISVPVDTACANSGAPGPITITTSGSVIVTTSPYTNPAVTVDSGTMAVPNTVFNSGTISYIGVQNAVGVELQANTTANVGGLDNIGTINLTGNGTDKTGILIGYPVGSSMTTGTFTRWRRPHECHRKSAGEFCRRQYRDQSRERFGLEVEGTQSYGIQSIAGTILNGDIDIAGQVTVTPSNTTSTTTTGNYAESISTAR